MRPTVVPTGSLEELRSAVKAFAQDPGPARFHRVCRLLERAEREGRPADPADGLPF